MASLVNTRSQQKISLRGNHIFGRQPDTSTTQLLSPDVSRIHATIAWEGSKWQIKDSSTNGTFVNGKRLLPSVYTDLHDQDTVQFGSLEADSWEVASLDEPRSMLIPMQAGLPCIELTALCALPSEDKPECVIYPEGNQWLYEADGTCQALSSGDVVGTSECQWRYIDAFPTMATRNSTPRKASNLVENVQFCFQVSQNEEHVSLTIKCDELSVDLGERSHHYLLLLLARQRAEDHRKGVLEVEQGWLTKELLGSMMGLQENHINIQVFRFRKQISEAIPQLTALHQAIARRTGALRLDYTDIVIKGGFESCSMTPPSTTPA